MVRFITVLLKDPFIAHLLIVSILLANLLSGKSLTYSLIESVLSECFYD